MEKTLLLITALFVLIYGQSAAQQLNFNGNRVLHTTGSNNLFLGINAGNNISAAGEQNTFVGRNAGITTSAGNNNAFFGAFAGNLNDSGVRNVFLGSAAGYKNNGSDNTFTGTSAGTNNTTGNNNTFSGMRAGFSNTDGSNNAFVGLGAGYSNSIGINNVFMGFQAGYNNTTGSHNIIIGYSADVTSQNLTNAAAIGANARVAVSNAIVLGDPTNTSMKVGIGTDSPQFPLDVRGIINLRNRGTIKFSHLRNPNLQNGSTDQFLTVDEQGETLLARYRLTINNASEWSDKVFAPSYQLRSLASVAAYIGQNGHLPGVPSAEQVVREGLDMNTLQTTLLEKIEELTLYTIQLEKANRQQQADIDELKRLVKQVLAK